MTAISYHATIKDVQAQPLTAADLLARLEKLEATQPGPLYAVAQDASGAVILPLRRNNRRLESLLDERDSAWRPLVTPYSSLDSLTIALAGGLAEQCSHVVLERVPDEDGTARQLHRAFEHAGWLVLREPCATGGTPTGYSLRCWRKGDPRNWPAIAKVRLRALVSRRARS
ncbi:MAG: hypothetical protein J2O44_02140 [Porphyrobacter sp.]|nr:hypothetical protein [Porphyrobacter sp.]